MRKQLALRHKRLVILIYASRAHDYIPAHGWIADVADEEVGAAGAAECAFELGS